MNSTLMTKNDIQLIKQSYSACRGCPAMECGHCPVRIRPGRVLHLAESYEKIINYLEVVINETRGEI